MLTLTVQRPDFKKAIEALAVDSREKIRLVLESVGLEVVAYLKSKTEEMRPPARKGGAARPAHPGHWADVSNQLVNSYSPPEVIAVGNGWRLKIANTAAYAIYLELHEGMFVVSGVVERGGIVAQALADVIPKIAPGFRVDMSRLQFGHSSETV